MNIPNTITFARIILALITFGLLLLTSHSEFAFGVYYIWGLFGLIAVVIFGDYLDGYFARKLNQSSKLGAWLDIAGDRFVEQGYWVVFSALGLISPWIAIIFIMRGIFVDGIRSFATNHGFTAFGESSMMKSTLGIVLVSSRFSRFSYAALKAIVFCFLVLCIQYPIMNFYTQVLVYLCTVFCLVRGIPVIIEGVRFLQKENLTSN